MDINYYDPNEPTPTDLEDAIGGCLGLILGFGVALIVCGLIYMISV